MEKTAQEQRKKEEKGNRDMYVKAANLLVVFLHCFLEFKVALSQ